jgi:hypothetical protein
MKTFVVLAVSIVLVSILFCPMVIAAPPMPDDVQIVQPDPSLPKEISAFWGKWAGTSQLQYFLIVEKIDEEKASLYHWQSGSYYLPTGWARYEAKVIKERGKYKLCFRDPFSYVELTLKGENLDWNRGVSDPTVPTYMRLSRVP